MRKNVLLLIGFILPFCMKAQIPSEQNLANYGDLVKALEVKETAKSENLFYLPSWTKDSLISIRDEICLFKTGMLWKDSLKIMDKTPDVYKRMQFVSNDSILVLAKYGKKKPAKAREYYDKQRLALLKQEFDRAGMDKTKMESVLNAMKWYYEEPSLVSEKQRDEYKEVFIQLRNKYSRFISDCYQKKECSQRDIARLFGYCVHVYPDPNLAKAIIDHVYEKEKKLLFHTTAVRPRNVGFETAASYYLATLVVINISPDKRTNLHNDNILRGYQNLFKLPMSDIARQTGSANLKRYINEKYKIYP